MMIQPLFGKVMKAGLWLCIAIIAAPASAYFGASDLLKLEVTGAMIMSRLPEEQTEQSCDAQGAPIQIVLADPGQSFQGSKWSRRFSESPGGETALITMRRGTDATREISEALSDVRSAANQGEEAPTVNYAGFELNVKLIGCAYMGHIAIDRAEVALGGEVGFYHTELVVNSDSLSDFGDADFTLRHSSYMWQATNPLVAGLYGRSETWMSRFDKANAPRRGNVYLSLSLDDMSFEAIDQSGQISGDVHIKLSALVFDAGL